MMFLIKAAFWLTILILLIPTDGQQQIQVYGTAEAAVKDVAGFCDRNPETCIASKNAFTVLVQKAEYGANLLMDFVQGQTATDENAHAMADDSETMPLQPAIWDTDGSQDTLNSEDREAAWGGFDDGGA